MTAPPTADLLADRARCRMLAALADGRALPASVLASEAGVSTPVATAHLRDLGERGLVATLESGPYRYHRLANREAVKLAATARSLVAGPAVRSLRPGTRAHDVRLARHCFGHLAGRLGVAVTDALRTRGIVEGPDGDVDLAHVKVRGQRLAGGVLDADPYRLPPSGRRRLAELGVAVPDGLGDVRCCVDWTEQRHHLAGPLGSAILDGFAAVGWVTRSPTPRALTVTADGAEALGAHLGITWPPPDPPVHPSTSALLRGLSKET